MCFLLGLLFQHRGAPCLRRGPVDCKGCFFGVQGGIANKPAEQTGMGGHPAWEGGRAVLGSLADHLGFLRSPPLSVLQGGVGLPPVPLSCPTWSPGSGRAPHVARAVPGTVPPFSSFPSPC